MRKHVLRVWQLIEMMMALQQGECFECQWVVHFEMALDMWCGFYFNIEKKMCRGKKGERKDPVWCGMFLCLQGRCWQGRTLGDWSAQDSIPFVLWTFVTLKTLLLSELGQESCESWVQWHLSVTPSLWAKTRGCWVWGQPKATFQFCFGNKNRCEAK